MIPGMNPRMMRQAMKKMGIQQEDMEAYEVIIKTKKGDFIIRNPDVQKVKMGGQETLQVMGDIEELSSVKEDDVKLVAEQAKCGEEEAREALEATGGDIAEAILKLQT